MSRVRRVVAVSLVGTATVVTSGCGTTKPVPPALALCRSFLPGKDVYSGTPATVGEVRVYRVGPNMTPGAAAFAGLAATMPAAWCWFRSGDTQTSVAVAASGRTVTFGNSSGTHELPVGAPAFP